MEHSKHGTIGKQRSTRTSVSKESDLGSDLYKFKNKIKPFLPPSSTHEYEDVFEKPRTRPNNSLKKSERLVGKNIVDAETGEPIGLSKATWNVREGRLDLKTNVIIAMGTGRLDISQRCSPTKSLTSTVATDAEQVTELPPDTTSPVISSPYRPERGLRSGQKLGRELSSRQHSSQVLSTSGRFALEQHKREKFDGNDSSRNSGSSTSTSVVSSVVVETEQVPVAPTRHPLITQYLRQGPLNPRCHTHWDRRTDSVLVQSEAQRRALADEDVELSDDGEGGGDEGDGGDDGGTGSVFTQWGLPIKADGTGAGTQCQAGSSSAAATSVDIVNSLLSIPSSSGPGSSLHSRAHTPLTPGAGGRIGTAASAMSTMSTAGASAVSVGGSTAKSQRAQYSASNAASAALDTLVGPTLAMQNVSNWQAVEEKLFQQLYALGWQYEKNKSLTGERRLPSGVVDVRTTCRALARQRTRSMRELVLAVADEKKKEEKRKQLEAENVERVSYLTELMKTHNEERQRARRYLHALEHDNEVIFIRKLYDAGYLW